jgi:cation diffusion facilitator CzcD-associated flavoprotein CzcO
MLAVFLALSPVALLYVVGRRLWVRRLRYHRRPEDLRIAVVGAGWGGLQCLERFRSLGVAQVDVFERYGQIGGTWGPHLRYHGLQIHGSMTVTSFDGFPYSDDPDIQAGKVMAEEVERYIHRFAEARGLLPHCRFDANVDALSCRSADRTATLALSNPKTGETWTSGPYDLVVWASMAAFWRMPELPGAERFRGRQVHTTHYSDGAFEDIVENNRHVVVIGGDKAACDVVLSLRRAGYDNFEWVMRKPYLFYKFEKMLHDSSSPLDKVVGLSYLATVLWTGLSKRIGAVLHWSSGYLWTMGEPHRDFTHFHGGVLDATQRKDLKGIAYLTGDPVRLTEDSVVLADGRQVRADVVIWATGNVSGIDTLALDKDGVPFSLRPNAKLYNHFVVPDLPVLASSTALWTTFGPMRATNASELAVYHLCVRQQRTERQMERAAARQISHNSILRSFIWARDSCWLQQWARFHVDLLLQGITPLENFLKHALEIFVLAKETPLRFNLLPRKGAPAPVAHVPAGSSRSSR